MSHVFPSVFPHVFVLSIPHAEARLHRESWGSQSRWGRGAVFGIVPAKMRNLFFMIFRFYPVNPGVPTNISLYI
jgi:hypothetical protein